MSRLTLNGRKLVYWILVMSLVLPQVAAVASLPAAQGSQTTTPQEAAVVENENDPAVAALTLVLGPGTLGPELLQVPAGETVTFQNDDSITRTIIIQPDDAPASYEVYIPMLVTLNSADVASGDRSGEDVVRPTSPAAADAAESETIVLAAGESAQRSFAEAGNVLVVDADDETLAATLLVIPPAQPKDGPVLGRIIDFSNKQPIAGAQVKTLDQAFSALTDGNGEFALALPPGEHVIVLFANGYSFANRKVTIRPYTPVTVDTIELVPLDSNVTPIDSAGGTAENDAGNTNVLFASGAVTSTKAIRLTDLPVDEYGPDWAALPGPFPNGSLPLGFVMFEPDGTNFEADAVWTIEYDGDLPLGTYVPCYYWIEHEARWGEPVDGFVVDLGGGKKGLQATLPHFSSYGFWAPPPPDPLPPVLSDDTQPPELDDLDGPEDNPNESDQDQCIGSKVNLASGELCQTVGTVALPSLGQLPSQVTARYYSKDINHQARVTVDFEVAPGSAAPLSAEWRFSVAGRSFSDSGLNVDIQWDGRDNRGVMQAPGRYMGTMTGQFNFLVSSAGGNGSTFPQQGCASGDCGISVQTNDIDWPVSLVRNDLSPFGIGWFSPYDTLLIDAGDWVTINQGDGRQAVFIHSGGGMYDSPRGDNSTLVHNGDGSWTRTYRDGSSLEFNADGRLVRLEDRHGNFQQLLYESNGVVLPPGEWGLTSRIRRIEDNSGNSFDYAYDANGWLSSISDSVGRVYSLEHDGDGNLTAFEDPLGQRQAFSYDERGMMTAHTDRRGFSTTYDLDDEGRVISRTWPTGTSLTASYSDTLTSISTDNGTPIVTTLDDNGSAVAQYNGVFSVHMTYDENLRPTSNSRPNAFVLYDEQGQIIESIGDVHTVYERNGSSFDQVSRMSSSSGLDSQYGYDAHGNLETITDVLGQTYQVTYDSHGQPLTITDPLGNVSSYAYDERGLIQSATDGLGRSWQMSYDAAGNLQSAMDPAGNKTSMTFDALNRLTAIDDALGGTTGQTYDANNNLTGYVDPSGRATAYDYDALNRLSKITYPDGGIDQVGYDANGNPTSIVDPRGIETTYAYDAANRPLTIKVD
ncbi:MAG: carboxypeptidase-like regulatory domain-containing protein, partial [Chloroflexota bacterium]